MDENIILSAKGLDLWYGPTQALKGVSMDIPEKQVTALIGPSGCGKSTILKTLDRMNDLVPGIKITGSVQYRGQEIYAPNVDVTWLRKQIGMVFQKPNPFPMSIYDNVAYGPRTHGIKSKSRLDDIVEKSLQGAAIWDEVKDRLKKSALGLSGGQQQRLCIARALAVEPDILLMDEATSALDPISTSKIEDLIADLKQNSTDLQRIGDQCANIAEISLLLKEQKQTRTLADIRTMSQKAGVMVKRSIFAYVNRDTEAAQAVIALDDEVDALFRTIKGELVELIAGNRDEADQAIDLIIIAKYLERIADHAVNIAQWAIFCVTGEILG